MKQQEVLLAVACIDGPVSSKAVREFLSAGKEPTNQLYRLTEQGLLRRSKQEVDGQLRWVYRLNGQYEVSAEDKVSANRGHVTHDKPKSVVDRRVECDEEGCHVRVLDTLLKQHKRQVHGKTPEGKTV